MSSIASSTPDRNAVGPRRGAAPQAATATTFTPKEILGMLRRRMWMIIIITGLAAIASVGLWFILLTVAPRYTSRGFIKCEMPIQSDMLSTQMIIPTPGVIELETRSKAQELRGDAFLGKILARKKVQDSKWYNSFGQDTEKRFKALKKRFGASPLRDTHLVMVSMTAGSANESQEILDDILQLFRNEVGDVIDSGFSEKLASLRELDKSISDEIGVKRVQLREIRSRVNEPGWETGVSPVSQEMNLMLGEKVRLQMLLQDFGSQLALVQQESAESGYSSAVLSYVANDQMVLTFRNRIAIYSEEREGYLEKFGEKHDVIRQIDAQIRGTEKQLSQTEAELRDRFQASQISNLERQYQETSEMLIQVEEQFTATSVRQSSIDQKRQDVIVLTMDIEELNVQLDQVEQTINSTLASKKNPILAKVLGQATKPISVSFPQIMVFGPGGVVLGLLLSVGLAFLLEFMDDSVKSPIDVVRHLHVPMLGMIPEYDEDDSDEVDLARISFMQSHGLLGESYRQLKTNLVFSAPSEDLKTILVTSSAAGGGTTTSLVNLGVILARDNKRVLLIDGNFHRPGLSKIFPGDSQEGLSSVLIGQIAVSEVVSSTDIPNMDVMRCGVKPPNPGELLGSEAMKKLLDEMKKTYDCILIDGPPSLVVTDARVMGSLVDGVMMVIPAGETSRGIAQRMVREFRSAKIRIFGILLNSVKARKGGYFRESFESYYDYVGEDSDKTLAKVS